MQNEMCAIFVISSPFNWRAMFYAVSMKLIGLKFSSLFSLKYDMIWSYSMFQCSSYIFFLFPITQLALTVISKEVMCIRSVWSVFCIVFTWLKRFVHLTRNLQSLAYDINIDVLRYRSGQHFVVWISVLIIFIHNICSIMT